MSITLRKRDRLLQWYLRAGDHPMKLRMAGWLRACLGISPQHIRCSTRWNTIMEVDPVEWVQREILFNGSYELKTTELILGLLKPDDVFLDVGAHVGYYSLLAAQQVGPNGLVISVEPNPRTFTALRNNQQLNPDLLNIRPILAAASDNSGIVEMSWPPDKNWGVSSIASREAAAYTLPCIELSSVLLHWDIKQVRVAKVDIENHELPALAGIFKSLKPEHIIFESNPDTPNSKITHFLEQNGYKIFNVLETPNSPDTHTLENNLWARLTHIT